MLPQGLRFAARSLLKRPGLTLAAGVTLALGIGANTAIFTVVNAVLLEPLPYPEAGQLVKISGVAVDESFRTANLSPPDFQDFERDNTVFERMAAIGWVGFYTLTGSGQPERLSGTRVTAGFFPTLRVEPALGRAFRDDEDRPGGPDVVILSDGLWRRRFGGSASIVGQTISLDSSSHTVVGVLPPWFRHPEPDPEREPDVYVLFQFDPETTSRSGRFIRAIARLAPGASVSQARAELTGMAKALEQEYPSTNTARSVRIDPLFEDIVGEVRPALLVLLGAVALVLLIACTNVANLLLASGSGRQREFAIRAALGAGQGRLVRQLLTESVLLGVCGGAAGLVLAVWGTRALATLGAGGVPRADLIGIDVRVLIFTLVVSLATGIVFGLAPALQMSRLDLEGVLRQGGGRSGAGRRSRVTREWLVTAEIALALVLLTGAGLFLRSFWNLSRVDPGFQAERVLTMQLSLPLARYPEGDQIPFYQRLIERVAALPGVHATGAVNILPLSGNYSCDGFQVDTRPTPEGQGPCAEARSATPGFFRAMGIPLVRGREFTERDTSESAPVAVISETMARRFFPDEDPIGRRITYNRGLEGESVQPAGGPGSREIVGIVGDVTHLGLDEARVPMFYTPHSQQPSYHTMSLALRTDVDPASLAGSVRSVLSGLDEEVPLYAVRTLDGVLAASVTQPRFRTWLLTVFAVLAVALALVGVAAVIAFAVGQRAREIGVRIALGARAGDVVRMMLVQGMKPVAAGLALGLAGAWAAGRLLAGLLFGVSPADPATLGAAAAALAVAALAASYIPARRAARVDPIVALRAE